MIGKSGKNLQKNVIDDSDSVVKFIRNFDLQKIINKYRFKIEKNILNIIIIKLVLQNYIFFHK